MGCVWFGVESISGKNTYPKYRRDDLNRVQGLIAMFILYSKSKLFNERLQRQDLPGC